MMMAATQLTHDSGLMETVMEFPKAIISMEKAIFLPMEQKMDGKWSGSNTGTDNSYKSCSE